MRILCLTARLPYPPDRGDRLRAYHFFRHMAAEHELTLVSFIEKEAEREHVEALRPYFSQIHLVQQRRSQSALRVASNIWRNVPLQTLYYRSPAMQQVVDSLLAKEPFDAAYVHLFRMAPYVADHTQLYRIVDLTDVISQEVVRSLPYRSPVWRLIYTIERPRIVQYERWVAQHFEETWLISPADRAVLAAACPAANIQVVPNGVDVETLHPLGGTAVPHRILFVGHMGVFHNVDAARYLAQEILPGVQRQIPDVTVQLVGASPATAVRALAEENTAVSVPGFVPDLNQALNEAAVFVAPLRFAAGVQNKVLEAMAAARPVVTTSLVNKGLGAEAGRDLLVADDVATAVAHIVDLLQNPTAAAQLGVAARRFVQAHYRWNFVQERLQTIAATLT
ncbi:MAG: glycosyltransferase [Anaerolineales bacterium]|nr:glycosyltransferase [Anaerolineales bacterium]MCB8989443.1 glycosyltransferase [Ardenticatenaceae bacterium]MCB9005019.1 glycosyltransferase [Ardenticatenaceae bacterium]